MANIEEHTFICTFNKYLLLTVSGTIEDPRDKAETITDLRHH